MFAIQMAKRKGAIVTGVDNEGKLEHMRALGADHVIDYRKCDFTKTSATYDHIVDLVATRSVFTLPRVLRPGGTYVMVGGTMSCVLSTLFLGPVLGAFSGKKIGMLAVAPRPDDLLEVLTLLETKQLRLTIHQVYDLADSATAIQTVGAGTTLGKAVVRIA